MQNYNFGIYSVNEIKHLVIECADDSVNMNNMNIVQKSIQLTTHLSFKKRD